MDTQAVGYYPTPACAGKALVSFIEDQKVDLGGAFVLDPAAGRGALPLWLSPLGATWILYEQCSAFIPDLQSLSGEVRCQDSLTEAWHPRSHVIANPPYGTLLEPFVAKIHAHTRRFGTFGAALIRLQWLDDGKDRHKRFRPDVILRLPWRVSYTGGGSPTDTHCWAIWNCPGFGDGITRTFWADRPAVSDREKAIHSAMAGNGCAHLQISMALDD